MNDALRRHASWRVGERYFLKTRVLECFCERYFVKKRELPCWWTMHCEDTWVLVLINNALWRHVSWRVCERCIVKTRELASLWTMHCEDTWVGVLVNDALWRHVSWRLCERCIVKTRELACWVVNDALWRRVSWRVGERYFVKTRVLACWWTIRCEDTLADDTLWRHVSGRELQLLLRVLNMSSHNPVKTWQCKCVFEAYYWVVCCKILQWIL